MSKKNLLIIVVGIALLILGLGIYLLFFTKPSFQNTTNNNNSPFGNFNDLGSATPSTNNVTGSSTPSAYDPGQEDVSPLIKISNAPIAGAGTVDRKVSAAKNASTTSIVHYTERADGHTMEYDRNTGKLIQASNTTIPVIYKAWWTGNNVVQQYLNQGSIKTYSGSIPATTTPETKLSGNFLPDSIYGLVISPKGNRVFYVEAGDNAVGTVANLNGSKRSQILDFPFNEWNVQWPNENTITLTTKASSNTPGYLYFLSSVTGAMTKVMGDATGLTTNTSPTLSDTIYSISSNGSIATAIYNFKNSNSTVIFNYPTFPEKCVWSVLKKNIVYCAVPSSIPSGSYPDDWYKGNVSFIDNIYKIDTTLGSEKLMYKLPQDQSIDAVNLFLDPKEENLYFTNKNDYFLWGLSLKGL